MKYRRLNFTQSSGNIDIIVVLIFAKWKCRIFIHNFIVCASGLWRHISIFHVAIVQVEVRRQDIFRLL